MTGRKTGAWTDFLALVMVNLLWAVQYPAYKIAGSRMESAGLNFWTLVFACTLLVPIWLYRRKSSSFSNLRVDAQKFIVLSVLGMIPPSVMLSWGISKSSASNAAILSLTIPLLMTGLGILMLREKLTVFRASTLVMGLAGTLLLSTADLSNASFEKTLLIGNVVILLGGLGSAFYNTYSKVLLSRYSELEVLIYSYLITVASCALISMVFEKKPFYEVAGYDTSTWVSIAALGLLPWGIAMLLWMWVLKRLEVGQVSSSIYLLPLFGLILSILTVHESVTLRELFGGFLIVSATAILTLYERRVPSEASTQDAR
jgi:drug/metabolite transporter (DMT)-like permease